MRKHHEVQEITFSDHHLVLRVDGQPFRVPIAEVSPRLATADASARETYRVSPSGYGIHWPEVDEDLSVDGLLKVATALSKAA